jgi:glycerol kinase
VLELFPSPIEVLRADGGASTNAFLMQFQADVLGCRVEVAAEQETTALGAAILAGRAIGVWPDDEAVASRIRRGAVYEPSPRAAELEGLRDGWRKAVRRALLP